MSTRTDAPTTSRWRFVAVVITIATAALTGACDREGATAKPTASATAVAAAEAAAEAGTASTSPKSPREALLAALPTKDSERFAFSISSDGGTTSGVADPAAHGVYFTAPIREGGSTMATISMLAIKTDRWARVKYGDKASKIDPAVTTISNKWFHLDNAKVPADRFPHVDDMSDFLAVAPTLKYMVNVTEPSPGKFTGDLDLSKAKGGDDLLVSPDVVEKGKAAHFKAEVDSRGRLTMLDVKVPETSTPEAGEVKLTFRDYGSAPAVTAPASEAKEAPALLYSMLFD